jgi:putative NIF3 family GTP cyclohydrolase 1 type 2
VTASGWCAASAWCSGAAQGFFEQAIALGVDLYVSGEISEQTVHLARESGVAYLAAGHHASERYGVLALAGISASVSVLTVNSSISTTPSETPQEPP